MRVLLILILLTLAPGAAAQRDCGALPATLEGEAFAIDGDTLAMLSGGKRTADIRLWGIQAPELRDKTSGVETIFGMMARAALADRVRFDQALRCVAIEWDRFCRVVARCATATPATDDLGLFMLQRGLAYTFTTWAVRPDMIEPLREHVAAERIARLLGRGLWRLYAPPAHD